MREKRILEGFYVIAESDWNGFLSKNLAEEADVDYVSKGATLNMKYLQLLKENRNEIWGSYWNTTKPETSYVLKKALFSQGRPEGFYVKVAKTSQ